MTCMAPLRLVAAWIRIMSGYGMSATGLWSLCGCGRRSLGSDDVIRRHICRVRGASEPENYRCANSKYLHTPPREYDRSRSLALDRGTDAFC